MKLEGRGPAARLNSSDLVIGSYYPQVYSLKFDVNSQLFRDHESTQSSFKFKKIRAVYVEDLLSLSISYLSDPSKVGYIWTHTYPKALQQ